MWTFPTPTPLHPTPPPRDLLLRLCLCFHFPEKMVFVGFKGGFRPVWVSLHTEDLSAKIFQVVPIPVLRKKKL